MVDIEGQNREQQERRRQRQLDQRIERAARTVRWCMCITYGSVIGSLTVYLLFLLIKHST